jgi:5-methylcytosine-specific restriction endonuclease McrA
LYCAAYGASDKGRASQRASRARHRNTRNAKKKAHREAHLEQERARQKAYRDKCGPLIRARARAKRVTQGADTRAKARAYYAKKREHFMNYRAQHKEAITKTKRAWVLRNTGTMAAIRFKRIAAEQQALPSWADLAAMKAIYDKAARLTQQTGIRHEVDHIIPIQSPVVCGLHVPENLQILTKAANRAKSNHLHASTSAA